MIRRTGKSRAPGRFFPGQPPRAGDNRQPAGVTGPVNKVFAAVLLAAVFFPAAVYGHGVETADVSGETGSAVKVALFRYSTGEPMMYAKVKLFSPASPGTEVLSGIADRRGFFCFVADEAGAWRLEAEDGMGHKGTITIRADVASAVAPDASRVSAGASPPGGTFSRVFTAVLGVSLIFNIFALWYGAGALKRKQHHAH